MIRHPEKCAKVRETRFLGAWVNTNAGWVQRSEGRSSGAPWDGKAFERREVVVGRREKFAKQQGRPRTAHQSDLDIISKEQRGYDPASCFC